MPSFKALPESNRRAVLAYLFELDNEKATKLLPLEEKQIIDKTVA